MNAIPCRLSRRTRLLLAQLEDRSVPAITGLVYQDFNANGAFDAASSAATDRGIANVTITAYDASNAAVGNALSDALGNYSLNPSGSGPFRIEFTNLPAGYFFGPAGLGSGTSVQFAGSANVSGLNLAVVRPQDISSDNPTLVTNRYVFGGVTGQDLNPGEGVVQSFPYDAGSAPDSGNRADYQNPADHELNVTQRNIGATWGLAYNNLANQLYAATYMKRTTGFGPAGPGGIYSMAPTGTAATVFADLNAIFADSPAGNLNALYTDANNNPVPYRTSIPGYEYWFTDGLVRFTDNAGVVRELGWDAVGKLALGGLDTDGSRLFTVALGDRRLYSLPVNGPVTGSTVQRFDLPVPAGVTGITAANPLGDLRPFAVEEHRGIVYIGAVNSAESTQNSADLRAYVFAFNPATGQFLNLARNATTSEAVFELALNYERGALHMGLDNRSDGTLTPPDPAEWLPWKPVHDFVQQTQFSQGRSAYPQPMLTGLSFDSAGNLTLGLRDRSGDQFGRNLPINPDNLNDFSIFSMTAGDTLRAFINTENNLDGVETGLPFAGWTLESNGRAPLGSRGTAPQNTGQGPGGGEFFWQDDFPHDPNVPPPGVVGSENDEVSVGGVLNIPGFNQTLSTGFNPVRLPGSINAGGVRWYDNASGAMTRAYELYVTPPASATATFAKGNGVGDLVAVTAAPIEIGNFIWFDDNANGIQDAGEDGAAGVTVQLFSGATLVATATTDANGNYIFSTRTAGSTSSLVYNLNLLRNTDYTVQVSSVDGFDFTSQFSDATANGTVRDSNASSSGSFTVRTPINGVADHSFDVGLVQDEIIVPPPPPPPLSLPASVAGRVFVDNCPVNGTIESTERGFPGVRILLTGDTEEGAVSLSTLTDSNGNYEFLNLVPGTYTIREVQPTNTYDGIDTLGSLGGTTANDQHTLVLQSDEDGTGYNFAEIEPNAVSGYVYYDSNNNNARDTTDAGIPNVTIQISGTAFFGTAMARPLIAAESLGGLSAVTDASGRWEFPSLPPGQYVIRQLQPLGFVDGLENAQEESPSNVVVGNDQFSNVVLCSGEFRGTFNFAETLPASSEATKRNFLSSSGVNVLPSPTSPLLTPVSVPLQPSFTVNTGTPANPAFVVAAAAAGRSPLVRAFDFSTGVERFRFFAYEPNYLGGVRVATGDVNGDGVEDIVTATGLGGGPRVRVFSGTDGLILRDFFAYEPEFRGGVFLAVADVTGDGRAEIITGTEQGGGPRVTVFDAVTNDRIRDFFAFDSNQRGGVRVAAGDFNNDGKADLVTTAGRGVTTRVRIFNSSDLAPLADFVPYDARFTGGVFIAAGDVDGDGIADVVTAADVGGGPHVQVFNHLTGQSRYSFFADDSAFRGGVRVALQDLDGDNDKEIITGLGAGASAKVRLWQDNQLTPFDEFYAFDSTYAGGVYVG